MTGIRAKLWNLAGIAAKSLLKFLRFFTGTEIHQEAWKSGTISAQREILFQPANHILGNYPLIKLFGGE
jgi:hypothetical protein